MTRRLPLYGILLLAIVLNIAIEITNLAVSINEILEAGLLLLMALIVGFLIFDERHTPAKGKSGS